MNKTISKPITIDFQTVNQTKSQQMLKNKPKKKWRLLPSFISMMAYDCFILETK